MTENKQEMNPGANARRKLLRGAFAAPAVLTVYSGSALATTTMTSCLAKANTTPMTSGITVTSADDVLFRYELWQRVPYPQTSPATAPTYWIVGQDLTAYQHASQSAFLSGSQWQQFDATNNVLVGNATTSSPASAGFKFARPSSSTYKRFAVLRVNAAGKVAGVGSAGGGAPVGDSCWNSFFLGPG